MYIINMMKENQENEGTSVSKAARTTQLGVICDNDHEYGLCHRVVGNCPARSVPSQVVGFGFHVIIGPAPQLVEVPLYHTGRKGEEQ